MKETLLNDLKHIRSILESEDDLEILPLENHYEISMKLNSNLQLKCLFHQSIDSLIIKNLDDLRLHQLSNTSSFESIRTYFYHLVQQSNCFTSLYLIIQLIQEYSLIQSKVKKQSNILPEQCQFLTWNLFDATERYEHICQILESSLADLICLQGVTNTFLQFISDQKWFKQYHCMTDQSSGPVMLTKNFRPESYETDSESDHSIHAHFRLPHNATIDIIHFHGKSLENLFDRINWNRNFLLVVEFDNDDDELFATMLQKSKVHIIDLWKDMYDDEENLGFPFNRKRNLNAQRTFLQSRISSRTNRYFLHKLSNLSYTIESFDLIGDEINQNRDYFGLQLNIHFRVRNLSDQYRLMIKSNVWIEFFHPFFQLGNTEDDEEDLLLPLRFLLTEYDQFNTEILDRIQQLFSPCIQNQSKISMNQLSKLEDIRYIYLIKQAPIDDPHRIPFDITHQIPIGRALEPIRCNAGCEWIDDDLREFFSRMNIYSDEKIFDQKQEKYRRLSECFAKNLSERLLHCFRYLYLPYGSFRLGLNGDDLDTVFVLYENKLSNRKASRLDQIFHRLKSNTFNLINYLEKQILNYFSNELIECRKIQALYPIISIVFDDQTKVEIFVQIIPNEPMDLHHQTLHGIHDLERLIIYIRYPIVFQYFLTFIRTWARNVGIYGQVYGYLGGYSWAILCAYICRQFLPQNLSSFSLKQFSSLIEQFFSVYSNFDWSSKSICLHPNHFSLDHRGSMRILCPTKPYQNTSRSTIDSTRYLIVQAFRQARSRSLEDILQSSNRFPDKKIQSILQLTLSAQTTIELNQWMGYMKSRLAHFLSDCENNCDLFVQTQTALLAGKHPLERFYFLGFNQNEQILSRHREFYYSLNRFFDQFKIYSSRSETMHISYKLMSMQVFSQSI